jgi:chemotaxis protein MotA
MFALIGILIVMGAIAGGYLMEHGKLLVLLQPAELLIIGGAAVGTMFIANPPAVLKGVLKGALGAFGSSRFSQPFYLETLKMLNDLFMRARKAGLSSLEADIEDPDKSALFANYPDFMKDRHALNFVCDTLRMAVTGGVSHHELDQMMELDLEVLHQETDAPVNALTTLADSLPGLGIVAAVLGVVITMGALGGPPAEIGQKVAAALVGTFLGILMCYGFFSPLAAKMRRGNDAESQYYHCLRTGIIAFVRGAPPILAVEFARRTIPAKLRPMFKEMEDVCRKKGAQGAPASKAA